MRPCPWSLLPSSLFIGVVIIVSIHNASTPLNTQTHPVSVTSITLCTGFTGLSSFQLVPVSTVPFVEGLHLRKHTATGATHHLPMWRTSQCRHWQIQGVPPACAPLRVQILSFWHTNFRNVAASGVGTPPYEVGPPPYGKSWIRHW